MAWNFTWSKAVREDLRALGRATPGALRSSAAFVVGAIGDSANSAFTNALSREAYYRVNRVAPSTIPDAQAMVDCYWRGWISAEQLTQGLNRLGIGWQPGRGVSGDTWGKFLWRNIVDMNRPVMDISTMEGLWRQGDIGDVTYDARLNRAGIINPDERELLLQQHTPFDVSEAVQFRQQGLIDEAALREAVRRSGRKLPEQQAPFMSQRPTLDEGELRVGYWTTTLSPDIVKSHMDLLGYAGLTDEDMPSAPRARTQGGFVDLYGSRAAQQFSTESGYGASQALALYWRGELTAARLSGELAAAGIVAQSRQDEWMRAQRPIPDSGALVSFAVREAWDQAAVDRFGYDLEFPPEFEFWMGQIGWNWGQPVTLPDGTVIPEVKWPRAFWRVHWATMSPSQAYEAYHRLRPDRIARFQLSVPGVTPFLFDDLLTALKISDYPAPVRKWLAAMSHTVIDIRQVRMSYQMGLKPRAWLIANLLDRGMVQEDAEALADLEDERNTPMNQAQMLNMRRQTIRKTVAQIERGYDVGTYARRQAQDAMRQLGLSAFESDQRLTEIDISHNVGIAQQAAKALRAAYFAGEFSAVEIGQQLAGMRLQPEAVARYVSLWTLQRTQRRRMATTGMILAWVASGQMAPAVAQQRLSNLGWYAPDALLAIQSAQHKLALAQGREMKAAEVAQRKRIGEMEKAQKDALALVKASHAGLRKMLPLADLKKWLNDKVVSEQWARDRMDAMGYPPDIIQGYMEQWGVVPIPTGQVAPAAQPPSQPIPPDQSRIASTPQRIGNVPPPAIP